MNKYITIIAGATPQSKIDHRKKRPGSKPEPPVLNSVPTTKVGGATNNISNASSTKPNYSENKKIEQNNDEIIPSSGPISGQLHIPDVMVHASPLFSYFLIKV
jgi:hypothetical protein